MSEWQPIETAPKGSAPVLLYYPEAVTGAYRQNTLPAMYRVDYAGGTPHRVPSHWMPLPAPPQR